MQESLNRGRIVIAGGSGFLGTSLALHLTNEGWSVVVLTRDTGQSNRSWKVVNWDARHLGHWKHELDGAYALVNLVGRSVDCIKTPENQDEILRSRIEATSVLGQAVRAIDNPPSVWVQMSTAHIYGDPPHMICNEDSPLGYGFAPSVGCSWEQQFSQSVLPTQRPVVLRTGFVIGNDRGAGGGALTRLKTLVRLGLGGQVGTGTQGMSWIHELDLNRIVQRALVEPNMRGTYIASSPNPVTQQEFMRTLRQAMGVPFGLPAFAWMVRIGAPLFMRTDPELALYGRFVRSRRLEEDQFQFQFPSLSAALRNLIARPSN